MPSDEISLSLSFDQGRRDVADRIIQGLTTAPLIHPDSPCINLLTFLWFKFDVLTSIIAERRSETSIFSLRSNYGDVLDAYALFASSIWTVDEKAAFESCECEHHSDEIETYRAEREMVEAHMIGWRGESYTRLQYIITQIFGALNAASKDMLHTKSDALKLERKPGKRGRWPTSPSQFIPRGAPIAVSAFMRWAELADSFVPIHVLCHTTLWCPSLASAMAQNEGLLPLVQRLFHQLVIRFHQFTLESAPGPLWGSMNSDVDLFLMVVDDKRPWFRDLCDQLARGRRAPRCRDIAESFVAMYEDLYAILSYLEEPSVSNLVGDRVKAWIRLFAIKAMSIRAALPHTIAELLPIHQSMCNVPQSEEEGIKKGDLLTALLGLSLSVRTERKCAETLCLETGEETQINLRLCARCQVARYCSKECQRSDWKHHKGACKLLKVVVPAAVTYYEQNLLPAKPHVGVSMSTFSDMLEQGGIGEDEACVVLEYLIRVQHSSV